MNIYLKDLYEKQLELDTAIQEKHNLSYEGTRVRRYLAFQVELNELANATRCFKFWSLKPSEEKARLVDEFADGIHFILSIGIDHEFVVESIDLIDLDVDLTTAFLICNAVFSTFITDPNFENYIEALTYFFSISKLLGFSVEDIRNGYFLKLGVNYQRQDNNY